jgi:hypothetical protein
MVPPTVIEDGQDPAADVDGNAGVQESGSRAVAASRHSYSIKEKHELVQAICTLVSSGVSIFQACPLFGLPHQYYYRCKNAVKTADNLEKSGLFVHYKCTGGARKLHPVRPSILDSIRNDLTQFVAET